MEKTKLKVGIIGQGRSGRDIHASSLSRMPERFEIAAVADEMEERRRMAAADFGAEPYADYRELLKRRDLDLIVNASPSHLHVPITLECLNGGHHVLCEKPLARKTAEVDALLEASRRSGKLLAVFQQSRYSPAFIQLRNVIESGKLGRIVQIHIAYNGFSRRWDWQTLKSRSGGNLLNTGPHPVDQALQLFGTDTMPEVTCMMDSANSFGDAEDYVKIIFRGKDKPVVDVEISSCSAYPVDTYHVQGTRGGLRGTFQRLEWKYYKPEEAPEQQLMEQTLSAPGGLPKYCEEKLTWHEENWQIPEEQGKTNGHLFHTMAEAYYAMLYDTLTKGTELEVTPWQVRQQIAVMEECFRQNPAFSYEYGTQEEVTKRGEEL